LEGKSADIEIIQLEIEALKDDKEQLLEQMRMASELNANQDDALAGLSEDELKSQNQKLRQAISALTMGFEVEKSRLGTKIEELSKRARLVDEYEKKLDDMDILLEEIEIKEQEKKQMEERLDECLEYEKMVEEMAEEILKKEDEIEELKGQIEDLEENLAVQEELNEQQEDYMKELNEEIGNKEAEMSQFSVEKKQLEEMVMDGDQQN
jgi:chromosome segregation ATPase